MSRNYFIAILILAICCAGLIFITMWQGEHKTIPEQKFVHSPISPFPSYIFGVGIIEPSTGNVLIRTALNRIVEKVAATPGMKVKKGDILLQLDASDLKAELAARQIAHEIAQEKLKKLQLLPRSIDVMPSEAAVKSARVELDLAKSQYDRVEGLSDSGAISQEELNRRFFNYQQAEAKWTMAQADLEKIQAKAWEPDLEIAYLETRESNANIERIASEIERTFLRSPIDGTVLQVKIHEGELPQADASRTPLMIVGNIDDLYLRVNINQFDAPFFCPEAQAVAFLQGDSRFELPLEFVRVEPYLVNKQNLTGDVIENVDARVLQVLYRIKKCQGRLFVRQQMDVFIEAQYPYENKHA